MRDVSEYIKKLQSPLPAVRDRALDTLATKVELQVLTSPHDLKNFNHPDLLPELLQWINGSQSSASPELVRRAIRTVGFVGARSIEAASAAGVIPFMRELADTLPHFAAEALQTVDQVSGTQKPKKLEDLFDAKGSQQSTYDQLTAVSGSPPSREDTLGGSPQPTASEPVLAAPEPEPARHIDVDIPERDDAVLFDLKVRLQVRGEGPMLQEVARVAADFGPGVVITRLGPSFGCCTDLESLRSLGYIWSLASGLGLPADLGRASMKAALAVLPSPEYSPSADRIVRHVLAATRGWGDRELMELATAAADALANKVPVEGLPAADGGIREWSAAALATASAFAAILKAWAACGTVMPCNGLVLHGGTAPARRWCAHLLFDPVWATHEPALVPELEPRLNASTRKLTRSSSSSVH